MGAALTGQETWGASNSGWDSGVWGALQEALRPHVGDQEPVCVFQESGRDRAGRCEGTRGAAPAPALARPLLTDVKRRKRVAECWAWGGRHTARTERPEAARPGSALPVGHPHLTALGPCDRGFLPGVSRGTLP